MSFPETPEQSGSVEPRDCREHHAAYMKTTYSVDLREAASARSAVGAAAIDIRIGAEVPALDRLLRFTGCDCWAFITAENPLSQPLSQGENRQRQRELESLLIARGLTYFPGKGCGRDQQDDWCESSFLVCGIMLDEALQIGRQFRQCAVVHGKLDQPAELHYCYPG